MNTDDIQDQLESLTISPINVKLKRLPRLSDYIPDLKSYTNPLQHNAFYHHSDHDGFYISHSDIILRQIVFDFSGNFPSSAPHLAYHHAGPRKEILFDPKRVRAAIVTCGGLCPGLNTVIRELVIGLWELYGVREIFGIKAVVTIYVNNMTRLNPKQVYIIGGDGTLRGAVQIFNEIQRRKLNVAVTGIPKTVDNDVGIIDRSFGFQTAVEMAQQAISAAHVEAESAPNGIGLVKLMGRNTGHITLDATLSSCDVDCCLIPEHDFYLEGKGGLFEFLDLRLKENGHAVVVVAEGAGQDIIPRPDSQTQKTDDSGNPVFLDIGVWLKTELKKWWEREHKGELFTIKYIDPTYMIRAVTANATDNLYCTLLAHSAIHGIMAGYTGFVTGPINGNYAYIPMDEVAHAKSPVNTNDHKWAWVRSVTAQPDFLRT
ncbi:hypothetical protein E3N88_33530 [Mikania micrantha]|uniref:Phosphofructokinase domain-containing protein n=1 Tax=Mikania micrantha TaxID=192012 RepID=A0A5N6MBI0_9ASTR|nr:hypothetical protein E3N88_33530 [Mikania micrantha]